MSEERDFGRAFQPHRCVHYPHSTGLPDSPPSIYLSGNCQSLVPMAFRADVLCIILPRASSTAWDVKFSEGMRLMKCFCRRFSCENNASSQASIMEVVAIGSTFWIISYTAGSTSSRLAESSCSEPLAKILFDQQTAPIPYADRPLTGQGPALSLPAVGSDMVGQLGGVQLETAMRRKLDS